MKTYKNKETGITISVNSVLGGDWELVDGSTPKNNDNTLTVEELKQLLKELGADFDPKAKKAELLELYEANKAE